MSEVSPELQITSADLHLYKYGNFKDLNKPGTYLAVEVTTNWEENSANWTKASASKNWQTAGGDKAAIPLDSFKYDGKSNGWFKFSVTAAVRKMVSNPSSNYGFMIWVKDLNPTDIIGMNQESWFHSTEATDATLRPKLILSTGQTQIQSHTNNNSSRAVSLVRWNSTSLSLYLPNSEPYSLVITNVSGRIVKKAILKGGSKVIDLYHTFPAGCFILQCQSSSSVYSTKFLIQ